jgi:hypothetical protein
MAVNADGEVVKKNYDESEVEANDQGEEVASQDEAQAQEESE